MSNDPVASAIFNPTKHGIWLNWLGVWPEVRRKGYAHRLVELLQSMYPCVGVQVRRCNPAARNLYLNCGFNITTVHEYVPKFFTMVWSGGH